MNAERRSDTGSTILFHADDGRSHSFAAGQLLHLTVESQGNGAGSGPELATFVFSSGRVEVRGACLKELHEPVNRGSLRSLRSLPARYAGLMNHQPIVHSITVTLTEPP